MVLYVNICYYLEIIGSDLREKSDEMRIVAALFSMLMPGFGQIYNNQLVKGVIFVIFEHFDNILGNINRAVYLDLNGFHQQALDQAVYEYVLFYPGFYVYVVWDAWFHAKEGADKAKTAIPFIIGGFLGLFASIYSSMLPSPTFLAGMAMIIPMLIGMIIFRKQ